MYKHYIRHKFFFFFFEPYYLFYDNYEGELNSSEFKYLPGIRFKYDFIESEIEELKNTGYGIGSEWILEEKLQ